MFLQSLRKIGTSATTRRRPARKCEVGIECLDTRAVPAIVVPTPGSPLLESGLGKLGDNVLNVSWDEYGHAVAQTTLINPLTGLTATSSRLLASNLDASGKPQPIPGVDFGTTTTTSTDTILVFGLSSAAQFTAQQSGNQTTLTATNIPVTITAGPLAGTSGLFSLNAKNAGPATVDQGGHISQNFTGTFSITNATTGANDLSGTFTDTISGAGNALGFTATTGVGSTSLVFTSDAGLPTGAPLGMALAFTNVTPSASVVGTGANATLASFTSNVSGNFSASTTTTVTKPTLAYHLPTPVADGDVAVYNFQTGQLSDLIRFQTVSDPVAGTTSWMLIYSDAPSATSTETAAPADVGIPAPTHSVLTQSAVEFGVQGYDIVEYAAEQATYSGLSDGNAVFFGGA